MTTEVGAGFRKRCAQLSLSEPTAAHHDTRASRRVSHIAQGIGVQQQVGARADSHRAEFARQAVTGRPTGPAGPPDEVRSASAVGHRRPARRRRRRAAGRNRDIGRAIVGLLATASASAPPPPPVVLHQTGSRAVIVVRPADALSRLPGVELVSLGDPDRSLIAFTAGMTAAAFELQVQDLLDSASLEDTDAEVIAQLAALLREVRRKPGRRLSEATIIVLEDAARRVPRALVGGPRGLASTSRRRPPL